MKKLIVLVLILLVAYCGLLFLPGKTLNPNYPVAGPVPVIYTVNTKTTGYTGYTGEQLNQILKGTRLAGMGEDIAYLCYLNDANEMFVINHMGLESGWGSSALAIIKNNLFGFHAFDRDPFALAYMYQTKTDSLASYLAYTRVEYNWPGGRYYVKPTIAGMNVHYASDKNWDTKIAGMMNSAHVLVGAPDWRIGFAEQKYRAYVESWDGKVPAWSDKLTIGRVITDLYYVWLSNGGIKYASPYFWAKATGVYTSDAWTVASPRAYTLMLMKKAWGLQHTRSFPTFWSTDKGQDTIGHYYARLFLLYKEAF